jgi:hypothetical protein
MLGWVWFTVQVRLPAEAGFLRHRKSGEFVKSRVHYPKRAKPKLMNTAAGHEERTGNPYRFRPEMGRSDEVQFRNRMNDYGKTATEDDRVREGVMVSPMRTIISV